MHRRFYVSISQAVLPFLALGAFSTALNCAGSAHAQDQQDNTKKKTVEPIFRVSKLTNVENNNSKSAPAAKVASNENVPKPSPANRTPAGDRVADSSNITRTVPSITPVILPSGILNSKAAPKVAPHPLDRAVTIAEDALQDIRSGVKDYTAILAKREQVNGVVGAPSYMNIKVRCPRQHVDGTVSPFSIYMKFLRPKENQGREVIWVDGRNDGKLIVHEAKGIIALKSFHLDPTGRLAMRGQRYPIYEAGLENLIVKLIEKAQRDRLAGPCEVEYRTGAQINNRPCTVIELVHDERKAPYEFHKAQVFIDDELHLPVRFAAYDWPASPGAEPKLLEEYTYYNVNVNVGLTDMDFNPANPSYRYPNR